MTGVLFDLDGTLLDTLQDLADAVNYALRRHGMPQRPLAEVRQFVGNGAGLLIRRATGESESWQAVLATFRSYYDKNCRVKTCPYEGVWEVLDGLGKNYPLAIVSNKPDSAVKALCADFFPGIYALGEVEGCPRKPAADMLFRAMEAIGAERCLYVGDSEVDVQTAKNAGCECVSVLWGFRDAGVLKAAGANHFCEKPKDLPKLIEELINKQENGLPRAERSQ